MTSNLFMISFFTAVQNTADLDYWWQKRNNCEEYDPRKMGGKDDMSALCGNVPLLILAICKETEFSSLI